MLNFVKWCRMLAKQALAEFLVQRNITDIFHLPGIHTLPLNDCLLRSETRVFMGRHESSMAFMADGYAKASGRCGVLIVTPGPGLGNVVTGCMESYGDDTPLLILHVDTTRRQAGKGILHELAAPESIFAHITKQSFTVSDSDNLLPTLDRAYRTACEERKGPVLLSIPSRFLEKEVPLALSDQDRRDHFGPDLAVLEEALRGIERPVIIGGRSLMTEETRPILDAICRGSSIPFFSTASGKGIVREDAPYSFGNIARKGLPREILSSADLVLAMGTRLRHVDARGRGVKIRNLIHIDVDDRWINKNYQAGVAVTGNMGMVLRGLPQIFAGKRFSWNLKKLSDGVSRQEHASFSGSTGFNLVRLLRGVIPDDTVVVGDLNLPSYWAEYFFPVYHQNTFITAGGASPVFYALPAAIGAKIGRTDRPCLAMCGDGGFLPTASELATIRKYNIPVVIFLCNNNSFGILEDYTDTAYGVRGSMDLSNPDFVKLARAFDIKGIRVKTLAAMRRVFLENVTWDEPFLVELNCPVFAPPWRV
jgi:acetolactate synthase I/II/III large subunit